MKTSDFDYELPPEYIAQTPIEPRHDARLMVLERSTGDVKHSVFRDLGKFLVAGDLLVLNETRVIPARLYARKMPSGGRFELLLLNRRDLLTWEALVGGKGLIAGSRFEVDSGPQGEIEVVLNGSQRLVRFTEPVEEYLMQAGHVPLPPYIHANLEDPERYQTIYSRTPGSAAAPTAGLHFTPVLLDELKEQGVDIVSITLHIGLDTFAPVNEDDPHEHKIHSEWCQITTETARKINRAQEEGGRIIAVGTTSVRTLESAVNTASPRMIMGAYRGSTNLFILPGFNFRAVEAMITNFHLPRSTLIMLVSAFAGRDNILRAYEIAKQEGYRFYSFGDTMLIV